LEGEDRAVATIMKRFSATTATYTELNDAGRMTVVVHGTGKTENRVEQFKELAITVFAEAFGFDASSISITGTSTDDQLKTTVSVTVDTSLLVLSSAPTTSTLTLLSTVMAAVAFFL
jgi:hypothetical protein